MTNYVVFYDLIMSLVIFLQRAQIAQKAGSRPILLFYMTFIV
jgi:hypothetical protein